MSRNRLKFSRGKMEEILPFEPDDSFTAALYDPPYDTIRNAPSKDMPWNRVMNNEQTNEVYRVLKPGAYCIVFGSPACHHRTAVAMEDAGFEIKDVFLWLFGDRMPHARDMGKKLDDPTWHDYHPHVKQAWEPIIIAQKPGEKSYHETILKHGVGALNIGRTRIPLAKGEVKGDFRPMDKPRKPGTRERIKFSPPVQGDRYPANVLMDEYFAHALDEQTLTVSGGTNQQVNPYTYRFQNWVHRSVKPPQFGAKNDGNYKSADRAGISRFFYCPKASPMERGKYNHGPCVKPLALMRWLLSLVIYPGVNHILDPYVGSGTTALAALSLQQEEPGLNLSGLFIENDKAMMRVARRRMKELRDAQAVSAY